MLCGVSLSAGKHEDACQSKKSSVSAIGLCMHSRLHFSSFMSFAKTFAVGKVYSSPIHKLHGFKTELSVLPTGTTNVFPTHYPGGFSGLRVYQEMPSFQGQILNKMTEELALFDHRPVGERRL